MCDKEEGERKVTIWNINGVYSSERGPKASNFYESGTKKELGGKWGEDLMI